MKTLLTILATFGTPAFGVAGVQAHVGTTSSAAVPSMRGRHIIKFSPSPMVRFHAGDKATRTITAILGGNPDTTTQLIENTCGTGSTAIATIDGTFASYGYWQITPGTTDGKCLFVVKDASGYTGRGHVVNKSN